MNFSFNPYESAKPKPYTNSTGIQPDVQGKLEQKNVSNISLDLKKSQFLHDHLRPLSNPTLLDKIERIFNKIFTFIFGTTNLTRARSLDIYRTQEHLFYGIGSSTGSHYQSFLNSIKNCKDLSVNFAKLDTEISDLNTKHLDSLYEEITSTTSEEKWVKNTQDDLRNLLPGQSTWIHAGTPGHSMMMRIEKSENETFNLYFANTGGGIQQNPDFHPPKEGTDDFRLVAMIEKIPESTLLKGEFLKNFIHTLNTRKNSEAALQTTPKIDDNDINAVYRELRTLLKGETTLNTHIDPRHFSHEQTSGSCEANCILAMIRSELSSEELKLLETHMQVNALAKHYNLLKSNADRSSTRKIMALDLIESLKNNPLVKNDLPTLLAMESDIKNSLKMSDPELKISKSSSVKIEDFLEKKDNGVFEMTSFTPLISYKKNPEKSRLDKNESHKSTNLKAYLGMTSLDEGIKYHLVKNSEGRWSGVDFSDKLALVCFYVANGDHANTEHSMVELLEEFGKVPKYKIGSDAYNKQLDAERNISILAEQLKELDHTRSGTAKLMFFSSLILKLTCERAGLNFQYVKNELWNTEYWNKETLNQIKTKALRQMERPINKEHSLPAIRTENLFINASNQFNQAKRFYKKLNVEDHLSEKNIWKQGLVTIEMRQPKVLEPIVPQSADFHLKEQLNQPNADIKTASFARDTFHQTG